MTRRPDDPNTPPADLSGEQLSAWLDDELPQAELEFFIARAMASPEHRARVARYGLIGSSLRGDGRGTGLAALDLQRRVHLALIEAGPEAGPEAGAEAGDQQVFREPLQARPAGWLPYALAAGVALAAVSLFPLLRPATPDLPLVAGDPVTDVLPQPGPVSVVAGAGRSASLSADRLTSYLVYHGEYSGMLSAKLSDSHIVNQPSYLTAADTVERVPAR